MSDLTQAIADAKTAAAPKQTYSGLITNPEQESLPPYHTQATWDAAKDAHEEGAKPVDPKDFTYTFNGYGVKAVEAKDGTHGDDNGLVYEITQDDFKKTLVQKQDAINFVQTHSSDYAKNV